MPFINRSSYKILVCFANRFNTLILFCGIFLFTNVQADEGGGRHTPSVKAVYKAMPSTVVISEFVEKSKSYLPSPRKAKILGAGVVIDTDGYILTSEHVVRGYDQLTVSFYTQEKYLAQVLYRSESMDLALVKVEVFEHSARAIKFAFPNDLLLAEPVIAIGNPYGLTFSPSKGILSGTGRRLNVPGKATLDELLQTSIKANPGNSGGPLINMNGEMIGLMIASQNDAQGISFAIPVSKIEKLISSWFSPERQSHSELGFSVSTEFSPQENSGYAVVKNVQQGKLNNLLGVRDNQRLKMVDKKPIRNAMDFYRYIKTRKVGQQLSITTIEDKTFFVQLFPLKGLTLAKSKLGLKFQRLGPDIARAISVPFDKGFVLSGLEVGFDFGLFKVRRGDMLFKINNRIIMNDLDFQDLLKDVKVGDSLSVVFLRVIPEGDSSHVETIFDTVIVH